MRLSLSVKSYIDFLRIFLEIQKFINSKRDIISRKVPFLKISLEYKGNLDFKSIPNYPSLC
ncbi:hypothetical protein LEP1GSC024_3324 [Leptospira noguchii str. 2001034031]|uniref:Uncharacterized protein n=1 Tax=Leptospira noguchii str. 2001034031 TaxID=1193053 RepID=M6Y808_9LEPT|nr:hypothetical protein LEP1GSC024_3324 [Leptospira noguchii str. 2001034031]